MRESTISLTKNVFYKGTDYKIKLDSHYHDSTKDRITVTIYNIKENCFLYSKDYIKPYSDKNRYVDAVLESFKDLIYRTVKSPSAKGFNDIPYYIKFAMEAGELSFDQPKHSVLELSDKNSGDSIIADDKGEVFADIGADGFTKLKIGKIIPLKETKSSIQIVFENVKLGDKGYGTNRLIIPDKIRKVLKNVKGTLNFKLERSNRAGMSEYKDFKLKLHGDTMLFYKRKDEFKWGDVWEFKTYELNGLDYIELADEKQYVLLDKLTITFE